MISAFQNCPRIENRTKNGNWAILPNIPFCGTDAPFWVMVLLELDITHSDLFFQILLNKGISVFLILNKNTR